MFTLGDAVARVVGTRLEFVDLRNVPQSMPQQIAVLAPVEKTLEGTIVENEGIDFVTAKEVGDTFGYKSPAYRAARMLRPENGGGVSTIRTTIFPIIPTAAVQADGTLAINIAAANPSKNATDYLNVNGRLIPFLVETTDDVTSLANKIKAALDAALQINPVVSVVQAAVGNDIDIDLTAGWEGESGNEINITVIGSDGTGIIYTNPVFANGAGDFDVSTALANFGETWYNLVINACDVAEAVLDQFENFNGSPEDNTGRWKSKVKKPFIAFYGSVESDKDTITAIPDTRKSDLTNCICPAPGSPGFTFESSAAYVRPIALTIGDNPPKSYSGQKLIDMPAPDLASDVGDFSDFEGRDFIEKRGVSTAVLKGGEYFIEDVNTHYHPDGVNPSASPYFRVVHVAGRSFNVIFQYKLKVETELLDKILVEDVSETDNVDAIDPNNWKSSVAAFIEDLASQGIATRPDESRKTIDTAIDQQNPERMNTSFTLIYSNNVRQSDSSISFGFNFG